MRFGPEPAPRRRSLTGALAGILAGLLAAPLALVVALPAAAHPGLPSALFDPDEAAWATVGATSPAEFHQIAATYQRDGYIMIDLDADLSPAGDLQYMMVFQRNLDQRGWFAEPMMSEAQLVDTYAQAHKSGMRLVDFETYQRSQTRYYAAIWVENVEQLDASFQHGLTGSQAEEYVKQLWQEFLPVDVNQYATPAGMRYAIAWVRNVEGLDYRLRFNMAGSELADEIESHWGTYRPLVLDSTLAPDGQWHASVLVEDVNHRTWRAMFDLPWQDHSNWWYRSVDEGYRMINLLRYETADGTRYAGIWRQNSDRPVWPLRTTLDGLVESERASLEMPGVSVAVMQDGVLQYLRGFGHADVDSDVWLDGSHVMRLASVAKAVGGVLTMRLAEQGFDPGSTVSAHIPGLPAHHTYTVEEVMSNRGCVRHYASTEKQDGYPVPDEWYDQDATLAGTVYPSAAEAAKELWDGELVCEPGESHYSTHGYTIGAAALEGATGSPVASLVLDQLSDPYQLGTLRPEDLTDASVRRSVLYGTDNEPVTNPGEVSWKVLGGGMEASARDLVRFGDQLVGGQILTEDSLAKMWQETGWGYAYGWSIGTEDGHRRIAKNGGATGTTSYLQVYPDLGISIVVLMNRRDGVEGENQAQALGRQIGSLVLAELP